MNPLSHMPLTRHVLWHLLWSLVVAFARGEVL